MRPDTLSLIQEIVTLFSKLEEDAEKKGRELLGDLVKKHPGTFEVGLRLAKELMRVQRPDIARAVLEMATFVEPSRMEPYWILAELEKAEGNQAAADLAMARVKRGLTREKYKKIALACREAGDLMGEVRARENALRASPEDGKVWMELAEAYDRADRPDDVIRTLETIHQNSREEAAPLFWLARVLYREGREEDAILAHRQAQMRAAKHNGRARRQFLVRGYCNTVPVPFERWCDDHGVKRRVHVPSRMMSVDLPEHLSPRDDMLPEPDVGPHPTPLVESAVLEDIRLMGQEGMMFDAQERLIHFEGHAPVNVENNIHGFLGVYSKERACVMTPKRKLTHSHSRAIYLTGASGDNYFHWITECMPRLLLVNERPEFKGAPVLINGDLPHQCREMLEHYFPDHPFDAMPHEAHIHASELLVISPTAHLPNSFDVPRGATMVSPEILRAFRAHAGLDQNKAQGRRVVMKRPFDPGRRQCVNETELANVFQSFGFEIIEPVKLSFAEQLEIFSSASVIAGTTGASFGNIVFAPPGAKVVCLYNPLGGNPWIFDSIARETDQELTFVCGEAINDGSPRYVGHWNFWVDPKLLHDSLVKLLGHPAGAARGAVHDDVGQDLPLVSRAG